MKILITGIHGFIGSNLVSSLSRKHIVFGVDIVSPDVAGVRKTYSWYDVEQGNLPEVDAIVHLAGKAHDLRNKVVAEEYFNVNTRLTQVIFDYFEAHSSIRTFLFFSSVKAVADKVTGTLTEDVAYNPVGALGESKAAAEKYILSHLESATKGDVSRKIIILRPCMTHGPGNKGNLNLLYKVVANRIPWPLGAFDNLRSFASIDNMKFVVEKILETEIDSGIYNMADDEALSTNELVETICKAIGIKARIWRIPKRAIRIVATISDRLKLPLDTLRLEKLTEDYVVSNRKIKEALHIRKMPVRATDGILATIRSFMDK